MAGRYTGSALKGTRTTVWSGRSKNMIKKLVIPGITAVLTLGVAVVFRSVLNEPQDVVPLLLVPVFLYTGYITGKASPKVWIVVTVSITLALAILYALA